MSTRGWQSPLAAFVSAVLLIEGLTGLWIFLAPFSVTSMVQVLVHTVLGLALLVPCVIYLVRHFLMWGSQTMTVVMVLGYALGVVVIVSLVSGLVLTWEAAFGLRRTDLWALFHQVSGIGSFVLLCVHVPLAWTRRKRNARSVVALGLAARRFVYRTTGMVGVSMVCIVGFSIALAQPSQEFPVPDSYALSEYLSDAKEYRGNPFAPTYARTASGQFIKAEALSGSHSCGTKGCHEEILREWEPSAHRFSAMNPPFVKVQKNFAEERSAEETRYCAGCHDPISLFAGAKDIQSQKLSSPGMQEGCGCIVCHSISKVDTRGNADYELTPPQPYLWEGETGVTKWLSDFLIRAYPQQHLADYDRGLLRSAEFCAACHKQFIPEALNRFGVSPGQNQYDEWRNSHWHNEHDETKDLSCRDCHMRLVPNSGDPGRGEAGDRRRSPDDRAHRHHGTIGTNVLMPEVLKLPGWERHVELTREWIRGETVLPEIAHAWEEGPVASVELVAPKQATAGTKLKFRALVTNRKVGHFFTTGPLDFIRAWLHVRILDADGTVLGEWGSIDPVTRRIQDVPGVEHKVGNSRHEGTMVLEGMPLDETGMPLVRHELWKKAGGEGQRVIFPGYSDNQTYTVVIPKGAKGPLRVTADLCFRRYRQEFLDLVVPEMERESGVLQPTVIQSSAARDITVKQP